MNNQLILSRQDLEQIIEHQLSKLHVLDLVVIINQYTNSWVRKLDGTNTFEFTGGERPNYLASVLESDRLQKIGLDN